MTSRLRWESSRQASIRRLETRAHYLKKHWHDIWQDPLHSYMTLLTAYAVADRILRRTAEFLTEVRSRRGCMTIQAALAGGLEGEPIRRKLIVLRVKEQDALRRRFERAKSEGDLRNDADAADLARFVTALFQGMTVQAINGASREDLLRLSDTALRIWPK